MTRTLSHCYVDESVHARSGFVASAFVFAEGDFERHVEHVLLGAGISPREEELKSSVRMDTNPAMRAARDAILSLAGSKTRVAVCIGSYSRRTIGKHCLQALQSVLLRNAIAPASLDVNFDQDIFPSEAEARRLHQLFRFLSDARIHPRGNSRLVLGIQVADVVAHSFGQIVKAEISGVAKMIDIGGPNTGYAEGTTAPLGWSLLMSLRYALFTRPIAYEGQAYPAASDPVVLDPIYDDPADYGQHPVLLGWGVQVAPESSPELRQAVERSLGKLWLGCIH
jgi:hypothetical protein